MDGGIEKRVTIKFCFKAGLSATETLVLVYKAYGNEALNRSNVCRWYSRFGDGRELVEEDERGVYHVLVYFCGFRERHYGILYISFENVYKV
jgi:hypothetical protein